MSTSAEAPKAPDDMELKNIVDKLAQFVARNGPEFENMTKQKQKDNPRFSFLYGGDYFQYYVYKVNAEQAIMRKQKMQADQNATSQIQALQQQLRESERNLRLQYDAFMKQQEIQVDEAIIAQEKAEIMNLAKECPLNLEEFDSQLQLIQNSCSKESISSNKTWFSTHCQTEKSADIVLKYIVNRIREASLNFTFKLHILYLVNDLVHNYSRKQNQEIMNLLTSYVPLIFSYVYVVHSNDVSCKEKLDRLKSIWLNQKFFDEQNTKKLENCELTHQDHKQFLGQQYQSAVQEIVQKITSQYKQYEIQHQQYSSHIQQQISSFEYSMNPRPAAPQMFGQQCAAVGQFLGQHQQQMGGSTVPIRRSRFDTGPAQTMNPVSGPAAAYAASQQQQPPITTSPQPLLRMSQQQSWSGQPPPSAGLRPQPSVVQPLMSLNLNQPPNFQPPPQNWSPAAAGQPSQQNWSPATAAAGQPPPLRMPPMMPGQQGLHPAGMRPPLLPIAPQPPRPPFEDAHLVPKVPYYDLPAALMVPLVKLSDHGYKSLDPSQIRLPPPMAPNERLVAAVDAFYAAPNHENPRDGEGWERLGLYEYFKAKQEAIKKFEGDKSPTILENTAARSRRSGSYASNDGSQGSRSKSGSRSPDRSQSNSTSPVCS